jgi:hypothetical protein
MLKAIALVACIIGFVFIGPKALAEFRRTRPRNDAPHSLGNPGDPEGLQPSKRPAA